MQFLSRLFLALSVLLAATVSARAEGLVQVSFNGSVETRGGAVIEVRWDIWDGQQVRETSMRMHLAQETGAFDVATLLVARLRARGAKVQFPAEHVGTSGPVHVFVENTTGVILRLGNGMWSTVTVCESAPEKVRLMKPLTALEGANMTINTTTFQSHTRQPGSILLYVDIDALANTASLCETLFNQALTKGLTSDRPSPDSWRPTKASDGALITGCSIELLAPSSDWGLEVQLSIPREPTR